MLAIMHVPYALLIGIAAGILNFIPYAGAIVGFLPSVVLALLVNGPTNALIVAGLFALIQQIDGNFVAPRVLKDNCRLVAAVYHPSDPRRQRTLRSARHVPVGTGRGDAARVARASRAATGFGSGDTARSHARAVAPSPAERVTWMPVSNVDVVGVPMDLGADRRGVDMGPSAIRYARLKESLERLGLNVRDHGNLVVPQPESASSEMQNAKYLPIIQNVCNELAGIVETIVRGGRFPLVLGGDHSIAIGTLAGVARARGSAPGVIWVDAHGDINTPLSSPSGNVHGMPVHFALEARNVDSERMVFIGLRDVDAGEKRIINELGVKAFTMSDIDRLGMSRVIDEALKIATNGADSLHVSFDMDGIDPSEAPGVGTAVRGGISYREAHFLMEAVALSGSLGSLEITEINPILDRENQTAILAVELILSALGKTTL